MKQNFFRRMTAVITAFVSLSLLPSLSAAADELIYDQIITGYVGDVNGDMTVNAADVFALAQYLNTTDPSTISDEWTMADMDKNGLLNAVDLSLLKGLVLSGNEPEPIITEVARVRERFEAGILKVKPTLDPTLDNRILMVAVNFPDCTHDAAYTVDRIQEIAFGAPNPQSPYYPMESISAYFERASYGRYHIEGDVYTYTAKKNISSYNDQTSTLVEEILRALDSQIDYNLYDTNHNKIMDTILVVLPGSADTNYWWPCSGGYYGYAQFDGVRPGNICIGGWDLKDVCGFNSTWTHELGHAMGMPDFYRYENYQNTESDDYGRGLSGDAGWELMDDAYCDLSCFSKMMFGWVYKDEVNIYEGGTQTYRIRTNQLDGSCIIIPRGGQFDLYGEYFMIEFQQPTQNNEYWFYDCNPYRPFYSGGIRILHCEAELYESQWGTIFKYENYSDHYDTANTRQRVLRLVNNFRGFFGAGDVIDQNTKGFQWYDEAGYETVAAGVTVHVDAIDGEFATITVSSQ